MKTMFLSLYLIGNLKTSLFVMLLMYLVNSYFKASSAETGLLTVGIYINELHHEKTSNVVSEQARLKLASTVPE